jgi:hypothetical protein
MMNRRIFIQGSAAVATVPGVAILFSGSSAASSSEHLNPEPQLEQPTRSQTSTDSAMLKIHGWDCSSNIDSQAVIRMTQSWRAAWR